MANIEKLEHDRVKVSVEIDKETFQKALETAYFKEVKKINIPGFRKGKAPRKVIENLYGEGVFYETAFDECWGDAYDKVIEENKLEPVDQPRNFDVPVISKEEGVKFTCEVQLKPTVKLGKYKGLEAEKLELKVTDEQINRQIEDEREKNARFIEVDRAVEDGDRVIIDYSGSVDGVKFDGGTAEEQTLVIGSHMFIPGFEEQLVGMNKGEEKDINVKFPEEYNEKSLAGKDAVFHIKLHQVQLKELPELDDEFAKDISEFDTLDELKADKKKALEEQNAKTEKMAIENAVINLASDAAEVEIPECMIQRQVDHMMREFEYQLMYSGISMEDYLKYFNFTPEQIRGQYHDEAKKRVQNQLVLEAIGKEEKIELSDAEMEEAIADYAKENGLAAEELKERLSDDDRAYIANTKKVQKTIDFIVENAKLVKKKAPAKKEDGEKKETAAKKPAAKKETAEKKADAEKEPAEKKPAAKKTTASKTAAEKTETAAKKTTAKKPAAKKEEK